MSIALNLADARAIATYAQLLDAIRDMADDENYDQVAIDQAIRKVEAHLDRELRTPDMEKATTLTWAGAYATLPLDFLEMREMRMGGTCPRPLKQVAIGQLGWGCPTSGSPTSYAVSGLSLRFAPVPAGGVAEILYYGRIPPLTAATPSNWVLTKHPDVYIAGALYHLARRERDTEGATQAGTEYLAIIDAIKRVGMSARYGGGRLIPQGMGQVGGVRT